MTTCGPRSSTRPRTRAPGTWTTCWPGGRTSRSRPGTAGCRPRRRSAELMARPLRWDARQVAREIEPLPGRRIAAERASQEAGTDPTPTRSGGRCRTSCRCWTPGTAAAARAGGWAAVWPGEWGAAATRLRACLRHACSPASSRPPTPSTSATTSARSASGWPCRTPTTPFYCVVDLHAITRAAGPGAAPAPDPGRGRAAVRGRAGPGPVHACSCRATWPSTPSWPGC